MTARAAGLGALVLATVATVLVVSVAPVAASEARPTLRNLEDEVMCPVCETTLSQSNSPAAQQIERFIRARIAAGDSESEIKQRLVAEYGEGVLAAPPRRGFSLLAWLLPVVGLVGGAVAVALLAWRWSRARADAGAGWADPGGPLDEESERRVDHALTRFE